MSNLHFPTLSGLAWNVVRTPQASTIVQTAVNFNEVRIGQSSQPRWTWEVVHNYMREYNSFAEASTLIGFYAARLGSFDSFLYKDPNDCIALGQDIGTGNGSTLTYQLSRAYGTAVQDIFEPNASYQAYNIYFNSVAVNPADWSISAGPNGGLVTFVTAPGSGVLITADFGFDWRVRFLEDSYDFNNWMQGIFEAKSLKFITTRQ